MSLTFSDFVRSLDPSGEPSPDAFDDLWTELRRVLRRELRARGLWDGPPSHLGVTGAASWTTPETAHARGAPNRTRDALDELAADAYVDVFVERLGVLRRYLRHHEDVDPVVKRRLRQFLHDRQRHNDLLGYRLYKWLRRALERGVEGGWLHVTPGGKIRNTTVLAFHPDAKAVPVPEETLWDVVRRWNDDLLADWMTAHGSGAVRLVTRLEDRLAELAEEGIATFRFKDLADAFKKDFRLRLAALAASPEEEDARPLSGALEKERLDELDKCVEQRLDVLEARNRTREQLRDLWRLLGTFARTGRDPETSRDEVAPPSHRKIARVLGLRPDRVSELKARLKEEVGRCLEILREPAGPGSLGKTAASHGPEARLNETGDLRKELLRRTAEAYRAEPAAPSPVDAPLPGGVYALEGGPAPGVEWLVLEAEPAPGNCLVVPADTESALGSSDVAVASGILGSLSVRCGHGVWVPRDALPGRLCVGALAAAEIERARRRRRELRDGRVEAGAAELETDVDPDYLDWCRTLDEAQDVLVRLLGGRPDEAPPARILPFSKPEPFRREDDTGFRRPWALAASVAAVLAAGFFAGRFYESRVGAGAGEPEVAVPWILAPTATQRGRPERLVVPPQARSVVLLIGAEDGDRLELRPVGGETIWSSVIDALDTPDEVLVRWPASLTPPGEYEVFLWRGDDLRLEFRLLIEPP